MDLSASQNRMFIRWAEAFHSWCFFSTFWLRNHYVSTLVRKEHVVILIFAFLIRTRFSVDVQVSVRLLWFGTILLLIHFIPARSVSLSVLFPNQAPLEIPQNESKIYYLFAWISDRKSDIAFSTPKCLREALQGKTLCPMPSEPQSLVFCVSSYPKTHE